MKIELKNISYNKALSESAPCFSAELYINDYHAAEVSNRGRDFVHYIRHSSDKGKALLEQAENYLGTLPAAGDELLAKSLGTQMLMSNHIDHLLDHYFQQKEEIKFKNKVDKISKNAIVFGNIKGRVDIIQYMIPMTQLLSSEGGPATVEEKIKNEVLPTMRDGDKVFNTNIPESILKAAGLSENQYNKYIEEPLSRKNRHKRAQKL